MTAAVVFAILLGFIAVQMSLCVVLVVRRDGWHGWRHFNNGER